MASGTRLGQYEILAALGAGGMGEVYRARDTKLKRDVALKVLPEAFASDLGRMARFQREAEVLASLNHPNIAHIYGVEDHALVMELVEGESPKGPMPFEDAWKIAMQIADALEYAHERGIVHRDLKPSNVKVTPDGVVKLLDFGLAKAFSPEHENPQAEARATDSPTLTMGATVAGVILGTAAYMAPEQAKGKRVDKRADIWSWGVMLYELLTGKRLFKGDDTADTLAQVLTKEPDLERVPHQVRKVLQRCLVKDPKHRLRDIGDAMPLLDAAPEAAPVWRPWPWILTAVLAIALAAVAAVAWRRAPRPTPLRPLVRLSANLPQNTTFSTFRGWSTLALSPDGSSLAVIVRGTDGKDRVAVRRLDQSDFAPLSGTEGASMPFFSPDSQWIGFFADGKLKKVAIHGGPSLTLCDALGPYGASWGDDGNIIMPIYTKGLYRVSSGGGAPTPVMDPSTGKKETIGWPQVLPGSQTVLFASSSTLGGSFDDADIEILSVKTGMRKTVLHGGFFGRYLPTSSGTGHLIYTHQNTLFAAPFDLRRLAVTGAAQPILEDVGSFNRYGAASFDFSQNGTFAYISSTGQQPWLIYWLNSAGHAEPLHLTPGYYWTPRVSPDGDRLAYAMGASPAGGADLWVKDLTRDTATRLTSLPGWNFWPVWTPDGKNVVFAWVGSTGRSLYWIRADGSGEPQRLTDGGLPYSFSPDGKRLTYENRSDDGIVRVWTAPLEGDGEHPRLGKAEPFLRTPFGQTLFSQTLGAFSPDGRWLAYQSDETGNREVYVQPFPGPGSKSPIGGGTQPIWSRNGRELFFLYDLRIMVTEYTVKGDSFGAGKPRVWSEKSLMRPVVGPVYDLAPDGKRFAVTLYPDGTSEPKPTTYVTVLLNFFDELRSRVPIGGE